MLTDKAKTDFEKWLVEIKYKETAIGILNFWTDWEVVKSAIITEWLDSVGIVIMTNKAYLPPFWWQFTIQNKHNSPYSFASRNEAVQAAIIKANELYNIKHQ